MTFPYVVEDGAAIRCLCKGCGAVLWSKYVNERGNHVQEVRDIYGDLYLAMVDAEGSLSTHSTPCCPDCAKRVLENTLSACNELEEWWGADVFHWFVEERVLGKDPDAAYRYAMKLSGDRHVVRAQRYAALDRADALGTLR
jgi:hypothetical protein